MSGNNIGKVVYTLLTFRSAIQIFHWRTKSYAKHKASDFLLEAMDGYIDKVVEVLQGIEDDVVEFSKEQNIAVSNYNNKTFVSLCKYIIKWLTGEFQNLINSNDALLNIRDEMLTDINKTLYLFSLN